MSEVAVLSMARKLKEIEDLQETQTGRVAELTGECSKAQAALQRACEFITGVEGGVAGPPRVPRPHH